MNANRKSNKKTAKLLSTGRIAALLVLLCIFVYFALSYERNISDTNGKVAEIETAGTAVNDDSTITPLRTDNSARYGNLELVNIPQQVKSEILHYPGFTVSFNSKFKQPNYVTWELTADEVRRMSNKKRYDNFQPDPNVEGCPTLDDYRGSGYDRGHMAPAGDMKFSRKATEACFLLTNMSPQHHDLNSGTWLDVEEKCRDWAIRDSAIVIVCGPILTDKITRTIGKSHVAVPERYFKVILSPYTEHPMGIGFIMSNNKHNGGMQSTAVSIDEVERVTGFDFFSSLPDNIEDKVEAECNFPKWNHK